MAAVIAGLLQLGLAIPASGLAAGDDISRRLGFVIGWLAFWPGIIIGVLSIWPRHRNPRSRSIALLTIWGLGILGHVSLLGHRPKSPAEVAQRTGSSFGPVSTQVVTQSVAVFDQQKPVWTYTPTIRESYDFSAGSDERLIKLIGSAREERYRSIRAAYAEACAARPADAVLALERVRFIDQFAYSEDDPIESAEGDRAVALENLTTRFPEAPGTVLYQLERKYGEELTAELKRQEHLVATWGAVDRARFILRRAEAAGDKPQALADARESFRLNPTVGAGLLLAEKAIEAHAPGEARQALLHPVFAKAPLWNKQEKLRLLLKAGDAEHAVALLEEIRISAPNSVQDEEIAKGFAKLGRVPEARALFEAIKPNQWNNRSLNQHRFQFELEHGDAVRAAAAYQRLRESGPMADAFLRYRVALFLKYPAAGWAWHDLLGVLRVLVLFALTAALPLLVILPVHYWSLLREKKGQAGGWPESNWGLRSAWLVLGTMLVFSLLSIWALRPEALQSWLGENKHTAEVAEIPLLAMQSITWTALALCLGFLMWRRRSWRLLGPGEWTVGRAIGLGVGMMLLLRIGLAAYVILWPQALGGEFAAATTQTTRLAMALRESTGALGMLAVMALFVPVLEEFMFRGVLLQALGRHIPFVWANSLQAVLFALVHENLRLFPIFCAFGYVAGELARRSKGLLSAIVFHVANNALVCLVLLRMGPH